jgi:5'(3')-deoxyribonucleotidase|tara:strand:+ start:13697 stop:14281 length:585 start_codon:yes stop_codon:yes gene_type:complete
MKIGLTINNMLRDTLHKLVETYNKYTPNELELEDVKSLDLLKYLKFDSEEELIEWMYVECPMEIFGNCPSVESGTFHFVNEFYKKFRDDHNISIVSEEIEKSKPATLFFLAKNGSLIDNVRFFGLNSFYKNVWSGVDMLITSDPTLLETKPKNKISIKLETKFNVDCDSDFTISTFNEIFELEIFKDEVEEIKE